MDEIVTHRENVAPVIIGALQDIKVTKGMKILEIGQGMDTQFKNLFKDEFGLLYYAVDNYIGVNNQDQNGNHTKLSGGEYFYDSMENLKSFADETFNIVFSCHAFEHCENPLQALREAKRVLKTGGHLIMATPYCCKHQIIDSDKDHIFVLNHYQLMRLVYYAGFNNIDVIEQKNITWKEQDFNYITIGEKCAVLDSDRKE